MDDGRFIYNRKNGSDVVKLLREWKEEPKADI